MVDLGAFNGDFTLPTDVAARGQIVGYTLGGGNIITSDAFSWTRQTGFVPLGSLGGDVTFANAVSPSGQVVGTSQLQPQGRGPLHAFSWTAGTGMTDLGTLGGNDSFASAVTSSGLVAGSAMTADGDQHAALWQTR
jgi:probable HAF family extracellular repeat protein